MDGIADESAAGTERTNASLGRPERRPVTESRLRRPRAPFDASHDGARTHARHLPRLLSDDVGREIRLDTYDPDEFEAIVGLYRRFAPADRAQGLPPVEEGAIRTWLEGALDDVSVVAWHDDTPVGQAFFVPDGDGAHELAVFVHQTYQHAGIGSALVRTGLDRLRATGGTDVWLSVDQWNQPALQLYRNVGFTVDTSGHWELVMSREL